MVLAAEMRHHRAQRLAAAFLGPGHAAAVVADGRRQLRQAAGRAPGQQSAPAKAHGPHFLAGGGGQPVHGGTDVLRHARRRQSFGLGLELAALLHVGIAVAQLHAQGVAGCQAVEQRRRHGRKAPCGKTLGHGADVAVDAEDLLQHHHGPAQRAFRNGRPGRQQATVGGLQIQELAGVGHGASSEDRAPWSKRGRSHGTLRAEAVL